MAHPTDKELASLDDRSSNLAGRTLRERAAPTGLAYGLTRERTDWISFGVRIAVAASIGALGLLVDTPLVVIGAMAISPLCETFARATIPRNNAPSVASQLIIGFTATVVVAAVVSSIVAVPMFADVGWLVRAVAIATAAVLSASVAIGASRPEVLGFIARVAGGTMLGSPLCVLGIALRFGLRGLAWGAMAAFAIGLGTTAVGSRLLLRSQVDRATPNDVRAILNALPRRSVRGVDFSTKTGFLAALAFTIGLCVIPLRRCLREASWQIRTRITVRGVIAQVTGREQAELTTLDVFRSGVRVRMVLVGDPVRAGYVETELRRGIASASGASADVRVRAVSDSLAMQTAMRDAAWSRGGDQDTQAFHASTHDCIGEALGRSWPLRDAGPLLSWRAEPVGDVTRVELHHVGTPLGRAASRILSGVLEDALGSRIDMRDFAFSPDGVSAVDGDIGGWLPVLEHALDVSDEEQAIHVCVEIPPSHTTSPSLAHSEDDGADAIARALLLREARGHVHERPGERWSVRFSASSCDKSRAP